jgi:exopolysaccharide biosynthesis polyprenyl glycosylphosphotransferase
MTMQTAPGAVTPEHISIVLPSPRVSDELETLPSSPQPPATAGTGPRRRRVVGPSATIDIGIAVALGAATAVIQPAIALMVLGVTLAWPLLLVVGGHYRHRVLCESRAARLGRVGLTGARALVLLLATTPLITDDRPLALPALVGMLTVSTAAHALLDGRRGKLRVVLSGRPREVREALAELGSSKTHAVVAACLTHASKAAIGVPAHVGLEYCSVVALAHQADTVVVLPGARMAPYALRRLHWALAAMGAELCIGTGLLDVTPGRTRALTTGGLHLVHVATAPLRGPRRIVKDVVERFSAALALVVLLPALAVVCLIIRLDSRGPALYRQTRVGRDGRPFTMLKFRSMSTDADRERTALLNRNEADGVLFKIQRDPRITRVGSWLRRWSVDEVPQLWNVVRGDMALVGPRPALPDEVARYDVDPTRRLVVKPGLTGLWQVSGRSDLSWAESVRLDVQYVDNWSLWLDARILLRTVMAVVAHRGAY